MTVETERSSRATRPRRRLRGLVLGLVALVVVSALSVGGVLGVRWWQHGRHEEPYGPRAMDGRLLHDFPAVDVTALNPDQARVAQVLRQQFEDQSGRDKYSEGVDEPWCADFVSWVMRESGHPLSNPNSGSWRIPGVYTLEEYFRGQHRFEEANNIYRPQVGDVVMYADSSVFHQHTNIVIAVDSDTITTVGGNEAGESGGVAIHKFRPSGTSGLVGFGRLGTP
ncbi:CHAP domain-containing protein [Nocardia yunnanensis]|uniref:CHAP domain-containing protein n=1 Tax=Nocardia yunnanensis TaxID=2382165 RepID=A0A386Z4Q1_9NOCA|nr:CHAP domain-containing protein [Nocardia yunnanensis]AYF72762.1 CHAP domain-containing protein [Nocardia yunnanensis]